MSHDREESAPVQPVQRTDEHAVERHETFLRTIREKRIDVLFLGDSITRRWAESPAEWGRWFGDLNAANFGVGADCIENLLWRLENGELSGIDPRAIVLLIGTNNLPTHAPPQIAQGVAAVLETIRTRLPEAAIVLLALLPRGMQHAERATEDAPFYREAISEVNARIASLANGTSIRYLDVSSIFIGADGEIDLERMPDRTHPVAAGYHHFGWELRRVLDEALRADGGQAAGT